MNDPQGREILQKIKDIHKEKGLDVEALVPEMVSLRERALVLKDPTLVKIIRLAFEHLKEHGEFKVEYVDPEEVGGLSNFEYLLGLLTDPDNKYNREELQEFRDYLKLYPEIPVPPAPTEDAVPGTTP